MTTDLNSGDRRKNTNAKQMPKYIQKERNQYTKCESHSLLGKIPFSQKEIYLRTNLYCIKEEKLPHQNNQIPIPHK